MKRIFDVIFSTLAIIVLMPVMLIVAGFVWGYLGKPIIFTQDRPGQNGRIFKLVKFRTMLNASTSEGEVLPDEKRLTRFGKLLRSTSLDELPTLWNVLKGDMSFVGPRPLRVRYLPFYTLEESIRHSVKPGITGLAQISGRNSLDWDDKFSLDIQYVNNISFKNDLIIILKTINKIFSNQDVDFETSNVIDDLDVSRRNCKKHNSKVNEI